MKKALVKAVESKVRRSHFLFVGITLFFGFGASAQQLDGAKWLTAESRIAVSKIIQNISPPGCAPGVVIASPSRERPDYYYHWVRDAALTMDVVISLFERTQERGTAQFLEQKIHEYIRFSIQNQSAKAITGLGEPKFYVDGRPYDLAWGRPQNDGPALRALALIHYARILLQKEKTAEAALLYDGKYPTKSPIKIDLEFVSSHWQDPSFDLWEEVLGDHFYTRMVQRKALIQGAELARIMGDQGASDWYLRESQKIQASLSPFWASGLGYIQTTLNHRAGVDYKESKLDVASILGALHGNSRDGFFDFGDERILRTLGAVINKFSAIYPINSKNEPTVGAAIGRYAEDRYDGENFQGGNPWVLSTLAVAEAYYEIAAVIQRTPNQTARAIQYVAKGDSFLARVQRHANPDGSLSEQMDRRNGYMTSARDLTWNYSAVLTALWAREQVVNPRASLTKNSRLFPHWGL